MSVATPPVAPGPGVDAAELAQLMAAFNDATSRLHETHDLLHREVHRLRSELADANEQLQRSRRLAALGEMAAGIAHEVRNPLTSIRLYARMLEDDLAGQPSLSSVASKIAQAVSGLDGVVGDVLSFARELTVRPERTSAALLLRQALDAAFPPSAETTIQVVGPPKAARPLDFDADPKLLRQALVNLIRNAVEAMQEAGPPCLLTLDATLRPDPDRADGRRLVVLSVSDTGPGIGPDVIDRMFNPFFTTRHTGTGLGLAIVHRIVDAHGGRIDVHSRTIDDSAVDSGPRGTKIELHLPQKGPAATERRPGRPATDVQEAPR
jgi:signal transduction histidine kinase